MYWTCERTLISSWETATSMSISGNSRPAFLLLHASFHLRPHNLLQENFRRCPSKTRRRFHYCCVQKNVSLREHPTCSSLSLLYFIPQGGRLVSERRIVADMYAFDMDSFTWERLLAHPDDHVPRHRYFHSTDACMSSFHLLFNYLIFPNHPRATITSL